MWTGRTCLMIAASAAALGLYFPAIADERGPTLSQADSTCLRHDFSQMQELVRIASQAVEAEDVDLWKKTAAESSCPLPA